MAATMFKPARKLKCPVPKKLKYRATKQASRKAFPRETASPLMLLLVYGSSGYLSYLFISWLLL